MIANLQFSAELYGYEYQMNVNKQTSEDILFSLI